MNEKYIKALMIASKIPKKSIRLSNDKNKKLVSASYSNNININNILFKNLDLSHQNFNKNSDRNSLQFSNRSTKEMRKVVHHNKKYSEIVPNREYIRNKYNFIGTNPNNEDKINFSLRKYKYNLNLTNNSKYKNNSKDEFDFLNDNTNFQIFEDKQIINILLYFIKFIQKEFERKIKEIIVDKINTIIKLKSENKFLIEQNNNLKISYLQLIYAFKKYEEEEKENRIKEIKIFNQFINENIYLRKALSNTSDINLSTLLKIKNELDFNKEIFNKQITKEIININEEKEENKLENNPFNLSNQEDLNSNIYHKRQKTYFNLIDLEKENKEINISISSSNTIVENAKEDILGDTLKEMTNYNKSLKRNNNSKKNIMEKEKEKEETKKKEGSINLNLSNKKQPQLYYRTPKEKQKIEFTK